MARSGAYGSSLRPFGGGVLNIDAAYAIGSAAPQAAPAPPAPTAAELEASRVYIASHGAPVTQQPQDPGEQQREQDRQDRRAAEAARAPVPPPAARGYGPLRATPAPPTSNAPPPRQYGGGSRHSISDQVLPVVGTVPVPVAVVSKPTELRSWNPVRF